MLKISENGLELIKHFEGCELEAYRCAADVVTIGYGHTKTAEEGMVIDQAEADRLLAWDIEEFEEYVRYAVEVQLNQDQFDALVSWTFNLGNGNLRSSTMLRVLNDYRYEEVPAQMKRWNKAGGKVLEGLIRRREAEANLFEGKDWR